MPFRYIEFDIVTENTPEVEANINRKHNLEILHSGVMGLACLDVRKPSRYEIDKYSFVTPARSLMTSVEVYEDGSLNIFVRDHEGKNAIGAVLVRPLWDVLDII